MITTPRRLDNMSSLQDRFQDGWVPDDLNLTGKYRVYLLGPCLPNLRFFLHRKVFRRTSAGIVGTNEFLRVLRLAKYHVERGSSQLDRSLEVVKISYDHPSNPFFVRPLVDEVRQVGTDEFLGQGVYQIFGKPMWAFWFLVKR